MKLRILLPILAAVSLSGCVMPDQIAQVQKDVADVQLQLRRVARDQSDAVEALEGARDPDADDNRIDRDEFAEFVLQFKQAMRQLSINEERVNELSRRLDRYSQDAPRGRDPYPNPSPPVSSGYPPASPSAIPSAQPTGGGALPDPEALYNSAYADFSKGNFALAISGFEEYQDRFSASELADNALYWIGECHFSQGSYPTAISAFDRLLDRYPKSDKAAASNLKKALAFQEQNQIGQAIVQLRYVVNAYPGTDEARNARDKLTSLGSSAGGAP